MVLAKEENSINTCFKLHFYVILSFPFEMGNNKKYGESFFAVDTYSNLGAGLNNIDTFVFGWMLGNYERRTCKNIFVL